MIYVLGSSGAGGELIIHAPAGVTVIAVNNGTGKTYSKVADASGMAVFKGLPEETYSVHIEQSGNTTDPIQVNVAYKSSAAITWFSATITATYPAGSTCTCSNGSTVYTAGNTSGSWTFTVPRAGTWTVSCANGVQSRSQNVSISYTGQAASVTLSYIQYLFKSGTGALVDWTATGYSGLSKCTITNEYIQGNANYGYYYPGFGTRDAIDLTGYTTLHCTARAYNTVAYAATKMTLAVQNPINTTVSSTQASSADYSTFTLDVSKLDGGHYIVLYENYDYHATIIATDIWLT